MYVNGFRYVNQYSKKPQYLEKYKVILDYQVYYSVRMKAIFVVYDHNNKIYYSFEHNGIYKDIDSGLRAVIKIWIVKA